MKNPLAIALLALVLSAAVWLTLQMADRTPPTGDNGTTNMGGSVNGTSVNTNASNDRIVRGPYPIDGDGCTVIDLTGKPPTEHDIAARFYTWVVEHPENEPCVRQTPPMINETVKDTKSEKVQGTNKWKLSIYY